MTPMTKSLLLALLMMGVAALANPSLSRQVARPSVDSSASHTAVDPAVIGARRGPG
jgi:hypothetical protein